LPAAPVPPYVRLPMHGMRRAPAAIMLTHALTSPRTHRLAPLILLVATLALGLLTGCQNNTSGSGGLY